MTAVTSEMSATVLAVEVAPGERVEVGGDMMTLESMKMEIPVKAPISGVVARILVTPGVLVAEGDLLVEISPHD